ncbi:MAG: FAD-dependent oxidoreductase [Opitutaceae bacterium]|nr:FAD-dependent oxidoreductase [Opitutaceae bacterium]
MIEIVIIGAGLAGLTCARRLHAAGVSCVVFEAGDAVGGRVRTDIVEGFRLDRGFQVFLTAYPTARVWLDYEQLQLRDFAAGSRVHCDGAMHEVSDPWRDPGAWWATLRAPVGSLADKVRIATLRRAARRGSLAELWARPETTALAALRAHGFSERMIERFLRPWFGGIFLDRELETSSRMLEFVFRMFAEGRAALPAAGMQAIPDQLAAGLPTGTVRLGARVARVEPGALFLDSGERIAARHIVVATENAGGAALLPEVAVPKWRATTTIYFAAAKSPLCAPMLVLNGEGRGYVNNLVVLSDVSPSYAPAGQALVAVSVLGEPALEERALVERVREELRAWFGAKVTDWRWLRSYRLPRALPARTPLVRVQPVEVRPRVWIAGDGRSSASIQGAMESGEAVAAEILHTK